MDIESIIYDVNDIFNNWLKSIKEEFGEDIIETNVNDCMLIFESLITMYMKKYEDKFSYCFENSGKNNFYLHIFEKNLDDSVGGYRIKVF